MRPLEVALVTLAIGGVIAGGVVFYVRRNKAAQAPEQLAAPKTQEQPQVKAPTVQNVEQAAKDAAGKGADVLTDIAGAINGIKGLVDGIGSTFRGFGDLFQ
jgi:uncharacterized membrane protein